jgi:hypothetical protein
MCCPLAKPWKNPQNSPHPGVFLSQKTPTGDLFDDLGAESITVSLAAAALNNAGLSRVATGISITVLAADINKARKNFNPDTAIDIAINLIGFKTPEGLLLSADLATGKQAGKWYIEKLSESLVGLRIQLS